MGAVQAIALEGGRAPLKTAKWRPMRVDTVVVVVVVVVVVEASPKLSTASRAG